MTFHGTLRTYSPQTDAWVLALVFFTFLLLMLLLGHQRHYIAELARRFFLPGNKAEKSAQKSVGEQFLPLLSALVQACAYGVILFVYLHDTFDLQHGRLPIPFLLGGCLLSCALYLLLRYWCYSFVNWVFFTPQQRQQWMGGYGLLTIVETAISYPLMCLGLFLHISPENMTFCAVICCFLVRFAFIPYTKRIFFPAFYGFLHLIAYLCALEIVPLLILWQLASLRTPI